MAEAGRASGDHQAQASLLPSHEFSFSWALTLAHIHLLHVQSPQPAAAFKLSQVHLLEHSFTGRGPEHQLTQTNRWVLATSYVAVFISTVLFCTKYCNITNLISDTLHLIPLYAQQAWKSVVWTNLVIITHILHRFTNWLSQLLHFPWTVTPYSSELNKYTKGDA